MLLRFIDLLSVKMPSRKPFVFCLDLFGHVRPPPVESTLGLQPHVGAQQKAITRDVSSALYTSYKEHKFTSLQRGALGYGS